MYSSKTVVDSLQSIGVTEDLISSWEKLYNIPVTRDQAGRKFYNENHLKIFRKIQKYNALGYTAKKIEERLSIYLIQADDFSHKPSEEHYYKASITEYSNPLEQANYGQFPQHPDHKTKKNFKFNLSLLSQDKTDKDVALLVEQLIQEKNTLLDDIDTLKNKVEQLTIDRERLAVDGLEYQKTISDLNCELADLIHTQQPQINETSSAREGSLYLPTDFIGTWKVRSKLIKVYYDTLGITIDNEKNKTIKITEPPQRVYGNFATFITNHKYTSNPLWVRIETSRFGLMSHSNFEGEIDVEYFVDEVPVAKAVYYAIGVQL